MERYLAIFANALMVAIAALLVSGCSDVKFAAVGSVMSGKVDTGLSDDPSSQPGVDGSSSDASVVIDIPNFRQCREHDTGMQLVYSPDSGERAHGDMYFAFMNVSDEIELDEDNRVVEDLDEDNRDAERVNGIGRMSDNAVLASVAKSSFSNGMPRFAELEKRTMSIAIDKAAYGRLVAQADASKSTRARLKTVFIAFEDVNGDKKFTPDVDVIMSSSEGVPADAKSGASSKASVSSLSSKSGFVDLSLGKVLKYQARTLLLDAEARSCAAILNADLRSVCEQSCDQLDDPLVIDFGGMGFVATSLEDGVNFDLAALGERHQTAWIAPGSQQMFVGYDRNGNGLIDDGSELFGTARIPELKGLPANGFVALAALDENRDGVIDSRDSAFSKLVLFNGDVSAAPGAGLSLLSSVVESIALEFKVVDMADGLGNRIYAKSKVRLKDGSEREIADVWFAN